MFTPPRSETEMTYSLQILLELEMDLKGSGAGPFPSLRPEAVGSSPNRPPDHHNSHYFCFQGLLETAEVEEAEEAWGGTVGLLVNEPLSVYASFFTDNKFIKCV